MKSRTFWVEQNMLRSHHMSRKLLVGTLLVTAATLGLVFTLGRRPLMRSMDVATFVARDLRDEHVRVRGTLVHGTLCRLDTECGYRFKLQSHDLVWNSDGTPLPTPYAELPVRYDGCVVPDTLRDVAGVDLRLVVEGERCQSCHDFAASQIFAMYPYKYELHPDGGEPLDAVWRTPRCSALAPRM